MSDFIKFSAWKKDRQPLKEESSKESSEPSYAQLLAELDELNSKRKKAAQDGDTYEVQILDLSIKLKDLDIQKKDILRNIKDLSDAKEISKKKKIEGRTNEQ